MWQTDAQRKQNSQPEDDRREVHEIGPILVALLDFRDQVGGRR